MDKCGYDFVIMVKGMEDLVSDAVKEVKGTFEDSRQYTIRRFGVNGTTVERTVFPSDERNRYASEKLFKADKTFLGNRSMRVYTGDALEGKMLIAFVALIIRNRMYTKLKDEEEKLLSSPNFMNVPAAIRELEKIEMIRQADGVYRLDHAVTANQKTILKAFGIDANYIKRKTEQISNELNPKILKVKINGRKS